MMILDTHVWVWYAQGDPKLPGRYNALIDASRLDGLGICTMSLWEVAMVVQRGRMELPYPLGDWFARALAFPGIRLIEITPEIAVESTTLPGIFHKDPSDQIIVATARILDCPLMTFDYKILAYEHVKHAKG